MSDVEKLAGLRSKAMTMKTRADKAKGAYEALVARAKEKGITTPKVGKEKVAALDSQIKEQREKQSKLIQQIEELLA
jgi:hypothetical protein